MRKISEKVKNELLAQEKYQFCARCGTQGVHLHHALIYAGRQMNEAYAIVPACPKCHREVDTEPSAREFFQLLAIRGGLPQIASDYPKRDWFQEESRMLRDVSPSDATKIFRWLKK